MFLIILCLVSLVEYSPVGSGNRTGPYDCTPGDSIPSLALPLWSAHAGVQGQIQVCSLPLQEALGPALAALWVSFQGPGCPASL